MTDSDRSVSTLLTVAQAIEIIDRVAVHPREVVLPLARAAGHRVAGDVVADRDNPPFDKSLMDGYAVVAADTAGASAARSVGLEVIGEIAAGKAAGAVGELTAGKAVSIMTGAPLPAGADAVVPIEMTRKVEGQAGDRVELREAVAAGRNVARRGSDCRAGERVLVRGQRLDAAAIAVAATVGADPVAVFDWPRVGVLTSGDELVSGGQPLAHQIRDSNGVMLRALCDRLGYGGTGPRHMKDDPKETARAIEDGLGQNDALLIAGGMSAGAHDYVPKVLADLGFEIRIRQLRIKPGKPFVFATRGSGEQAKFVFGLPGNPVSAYVCTLRLANRLLRRMAGGEAEEMILNLPLAEAIGANGPREFYQPAEITAEGAVRPLAWKGSADIFTLAKARGLIVSGENAAKAEAGSLVRVMIV
jgi:molybdopterin molybdotransferase